MNYRWFVMAMQRPSPMCEISQDDHENPVQLMLQIVSLILIPLNIKLKV